MLHPMSSRRKNLESIKHPWEGPLQLVEERAAATIGGLQRRRRDPEGAFTPAADGGRSGAAGETNG